MKRPVKRDELVEMIAASIEETRGDDSLAGSHEARRLARAAVGRLQAEGIDFRLGWPKLADRNRPLLPMSFDELGAMALLASVCGGTFHFFANHSLSLETLADDLLLLGMLISGGVLSSAVIIAVMYGIAWLARERRRRLSARAAVKREQLAQLLAAQGG